MDKITRRELAVTALGRPAPSRSRHRGDSTPSGNPGARHFPNVVLRTHEGCTVRFYDDLIRGKTVLLTFMYATCEGICPAGIANLKRVHERLGDRAGRDVFIYSITTRPNEDTPQVLKTFAELHGTGRGWLFLTGASGDVDRLRRTLGFVDADPVAALDASSHVGVILYGNEPLNRWAATPALGNPDQIYRAVRWMEGAMPGLETSDRAGARR